MSTPTPVQILLSALEKIAAYKPGENSARELCVKYELLAMNAIKEYRQSQSCDWAEAGLADQCLKHDHSPASELIANRSTLCDTCGKWVTDPTHACSKDSANRGLSGDRPEIPDKDHGAGGEFFLFMQEHLKAPDVGSNNWITYLLDNVPKQIITPEEIEAAANDIANDLISNGHTVNFTTYEAAKLGAEFILKKLGLHGV